MYEQNKSKISRHINTLEEVVTKFPSFQILWVSGPENEQFKKELNLADGYPQAVLISRSKRVSRPLRSAFDLDLISEFLKISKEGKAKRFVPLDRDPSFSHHKEDL
jgi:hypothetical protein